jgi:hypothetical protein
MSKIVLREKAVSLRLEGQTYRQIREELGVSKSTLSLWLQKLPLTELQIEVLSKNKERSKELSREKFRNTCLQKRITRLRGVYEEQSRELLLLSEKELFLSGLFLYWGEGEKRHGIVSISNTDPRVVKFALIWMTKSLKISGKKIKIQLQLYKDMNVQESIVFWSKSLNIPANQFYKPYIKKTNREGLTYKTFGYGTCKIVYCSVELSEKIAMSIKAISDNYGAKTEAFWYN